PTVNAGTDKEVNTLAAQDATTSDLGSGLATHQWSKISGLGIITFSAATSVDTNISASVDDTYIIRLTVTDMAGNSNSDDITFVWDTTPPTVALSSSTPDPTNGFIFVVAQFSETVTDFGAIDIAVGNGTVDSFVAVDGDTYQFNVNPADGPSVAVTIDVPMATSVDAAGNANIASNQITRTSDTVAPAVSSITTTDANLDGAVDTATIVFTEAMKDSTFNFADFTIGGIPATNFSTGITDDDTVVLSHAGVAGTDAKTVAYVPGATITDLAGNIRIAFTSGSVDAAKPVLLSARTVTTTSIEATFSEDLNGVTVNISGNEFTVTGYAVSAASETSNGVITLTVTTMPTDATPVVTYTSNGPLNDLAPVPNTAVTPVSVTAVDGVAPVLTAVSISSNNDGDLTAPEWAKVGDIARIIFTSSEPIATPVVTIAGRPATSIEGPGIGNSWAANLNSFTGIETNGVLPFLIAFADMAPIPNAGTPVTVTGDGSFVFFDSVNPTVYAGDDKEVNTLVFQDATVSDPAPASEVATYAWTNQTPLVGTITFSNPSGTGTGVDTNISASADGIYTLRLTATDNAGNSFFDEMTFIWDTTNPVQEALIAPEPQIDVPITAGTAKVRFDENIVLLDASRVLLQNNSGASYKGTVAVDGGDSTVLNIGYTGLSYGTVYDIIVKSNSVRDVAGNKVISLFTAQFTTEIDEVPPVVNSFSASSITTTGATLNVTTTESATCRYSVGSISEYSAMTPFTTTGGTVHIEVLTGLTPSTGYNYYVRCADTSPQANIMTGTPPIIGFTTLTPDTTAPDITNIHTGTINQTSTTANWNTDEPSDSQVEYGPTSSYGSTTSLTLTLVTGHTKTLSGLTPGTLYHYRVKSRDAVGNLAVSGDNIFTTATPDPDTIAPPVPSITTSTVTVNSDSYTISGTAGADTPSDSIRTVSVYNGADLVGTAVVPVGQTGWSVSVTLTQNAANSFTAISTDSSGNSSSASPAVVITEDGTVGADVTPPDVPVISNSDATIDADTYEIVGTEADDSGVRTISLFESGVVVGTAVLPAGQTDWAITVALNQGVPNVFTAKATNEAGNSSVASGPLTITEATVADATPPVITLLGVNPQTLTVGDAYTELGATAADNVDGDITADIVIDDSAVNMAVAGTYIVTYNVSDVADNDAIQETRTVIVNAAFDDTATLAVTGIDMVANASGSTGFAMANDTFENGWAWIFHVTVPTDETLFAMKFSDFVSGLNSIPAAANIRFYSVQSSDAFNAASARVIAGANVYSADINLTDDISSGTAGRQIDVRVEVKVPSGTPGGSYSTGYGVQSEVD
ncbi:MAG: immunoglobulin-like domain-containing protein, partial [Patescibacteria group bacterium]